MKLHTWKKAFGFVMGRICTFLRCSIASHVRCARKEFGQKKCFYVTKKFTDTETKTHQHDFYSQKTHLPYHTLIVFFVTESLPTLPGANCVFEMITVFSIFNMRGKGNVQLSVGSFLSSIVEIIHFWGERWHNHFRSLTRRIYCSFNGSLLAIRSRQVFERS